MITYQVEHLTSHLEELKPLLVKHWLELALDQDRVPLDPCWEIYEQKDVEHNIMFVTARDNGRLIGYFIGFVGPGLHYRTCKTLQIDIFWLHPEFREDSLSYVEGEVIADGLIVKVLEEAKVLGVQRMFAGSKLHKDSGALFERHGGIEIERYFSFWIGG